jgi:tetratricopeptide (TPR) repeat protein
MHAALSIAGLERSWDRYEKAEQMYLRALAGREKALGLDHTSTLDTIPNLGNLYGDQGKLEVAEQMCTRAQSREIVAPFDLLTRPHVALSL